MDEILWCYHLNETSSAVLWHDTIYSVCSFNFWVCRWNPVTIHMLPLLQNFHATVYLSCCFTFWICGWNPVVLPFKWILVSSTFTWYCIFCIFESVDQIPWFDQSNETSSIVLLHGTKYLSGFLVNFILWPLFWVKRLKGSKLKEPW